MEVEVKKMVDMEHVNMEGEKREEDMDKHPNHSFSLLTRNSKLNN